MPSIGSVNHMLSRVAIERQMNGLDQRIRDAASARQQRVVEQIQNNDIEIKQSIVKARENYLGTVVDVFA